MMTVGTPTTSENENENEESGIFIDVSQDSSRGQEVGTVRGVLGDVTNVQVGKQTCLSIVCGRHVLGS